METEEGNLVPSLKTNKLLLDEVEQSKLSESLKNKTNSNNAVTLYNVSIIFKNSTFSKFSLCFIERCFPMFAESNSFLELDFNSVGLLLSDSELNIDSELQVFNAAYGWLCNNLTERRKYAKDLFLKIRFSLLSTPALNYILDRNSCLKNEFFDIIKQVLVNKTKSCDSKKLSSINRYCSPNNFNIILCGGERSYKVVNDVYSIKINNRSIVNILPQMTEGRQCFETVCIKGEVYAIGGLDYNGNSIMSVEKYSPTANAWEKVSDMYDDRSQFCACSFMSNVYVVGGNTKGSGLDGTKSCVEFNPKNRTWKEIARMSENRWCAACTVFDGKILVSGGKSFNGVSKTVESYDHIADSWSYMPNMVYERRQHKIVSIRNKFFAVGGFSTDSCEVFDLACNKFVLLQQPPACYREFLNNVEGAISIGGKIVVFRDRRSSIVLYDTKNFQWSEKICEATRYLVSYSIAKIPQL